jgi:hypothetical protein
VKMAKRNPTEDLAAEGYERFHGKESEHVVLDEFDFPPPQELMVQFGNFLPKLPRWVSALGELKALSYEKEDEEFGLQPEEIQKFKKPYPLLCSDFRWKREGRETLFIVGGNYVADDEPDLICGNLIWITYTTVKTWDDFQPIDYTHRFDSPWPILAQNETGDQLFIIRDQSRFSIDRQGSVSAGIAG